ncbi:CYTH and CHAD domain-containing protein [Williamsia sterculiae]|uniref:CHAD domain-containing protein n=1 Tax=Williamsia sterculiae TaxID=1344003 RepID=A0A1N7G9J9_9NOCA|nr:CYTH and CHAD domain-containing protein [Williamsia sterculiae]SIS09218.1 CHAD domain-containing protein [Williamsia sterculiae]
MSATEHLEIELKFDVDAGRVVPDLSGLPGVATVADPYVESLQAIYYDTERLDLLSNKITLRRRRGGHDAGWHLKRPSVGAGRRELHLPDDGIVADIGDIAAAGVESSSPVPDELIVPVLALTRHHTLIPIASIDTRRTVTELLDAEGAVLAVMCADQVTAQSLLPHGAGHQWAEWEFELDGGGRGLLDAAESALIAAGAQTASSASKLARTVGDIPPRRRHGMGAEPTALELVLTQVAQHVDLLVANDPLVRADEPDAVHQMRVAARRIRSVLHGFPDVIWGPKTRHVADELKLLGQLLGAARDAEVQLARNEDSLAGEDPGAGLRTLLVDELARTRADAMAVIQTSMHSDRYFALLDGLDELLARPEPGERAENPAEDEIRRAVRKGRKAVARAQAHAAELPEGCDEWTEAMHTVRKKAKRLRYSAESAADLPNGVATKKHKTIAKAAKRIQSSLGDLHDAALARERLREALTHDGLHRHDAFVLGRIDAHEQRLSDAALAEYRAVAREL